MDKLTAEKFFKDSHELSDVAFSAKGVISISQALDLMESYYEAKRKEMTAQPTDYTEESKIADMIGGAMIKHKELGMTYIEDNPATPFVNKPKGNPLSQLSFADLVALYEMLADLLLRHQQAEPQIKISAKMTEVLSELNSRTEQITGLTL